MIRNKSMEDNFKDVDIKNRTIVGIDIGTTNFFNCADEFLNEVFSYKSDKLPKLVRYYNDMANEVRNNSKLSYKEQEQLMAKPKKYIEDYVEETIYNRIADTIYYMFPPNSLFVIGDNSLNDSNVIWSANALIIQTVNQALKTYFKQSWHIQDKKVVGVEERQTSITCPICGNIDGDNRTIDNEFYCQSCHFTYDADDIVASINIAQRYRKQNEIYQRLTNRLQVINY